MARTAAKRDPRPKPDQKAKIDPRAVVRQVLTREGAHLGLDEAVADFPTTEINTKPPNVPYSFWHLLEHIRVAQWDLIEYVTNSKHASPEWPGGYWPAPDATTDAAGWKRTITAIKADLRRLHRLLADPNVDVFAPVPFAENTPLLRCAVLAIDHNAYHLGEFAILRQVMQLWPKSRVG